MRPPLRNARLLGVQLVLLGATLVALATLQYRWIGHLADAERERRGSDAAGVARRVAHRLGDELGRVFEALLARASEPLEPLYQRWRSEVAHPELVETVYVAERQNDEWSLSRFEANGRLSATAWEGGLEPLQRSLERLEGRHPNPSWPRPYFSEPPGLFIVQRPDDQWPDDAERPSRVIFARLDTGAVARLLQSFASAEAESSYEFALMSEERVLARTAPDWSGGADAMAPLPPPRRGQRPPHAKRRRSGAADWQIAVRHPGGLDALVAAARRRNLALSGAILLILGASSAMLVALVRRGEQLRAQQVAFVSMMTHELNTPVAVLRAAGENLQDGVVEGREQLATYGRTIVAETERLRVMTGDILAITGSVARHTRGTRERVALPPLVAAVVDRCRVVTRGTPIVIETTVEPELPEVSADAQALGRAIENLILNAIRHGGSGAWIGVRARAASKGDVTITVEDRGPGLSQEDAAQVFEPFYRGANSTYTDGAGLGLAIVRQIVIEHGGSVTIDRTEGGAAFTIHLPPARPNA